MWPVPFADQRRSCADVSNQLCQIPIRSGYCKAVYHKPLARVTAQALPVFDIKFAFTFFSQFFAAINVKTFSLQLSRFWLVTLKRKTSRDE